MEINPRIVVVIADFAYQPSLKKSDVVVLNQSFNSFNAFAKLKFQLRQNLIKKLKQN